MAATPRLEYIRALVAQFPSAPAKTLARKAYEEHPEWWKDLETCRTQVRYVLGVQGNASRRNMTDRSLTRPPRQAGWSDVIPEALIQLPDWGAECIDGPHRVLVLSDLQIPFHDPAAIEIALDYGIKHKPTLILLNGDIADHYAISDFLKDPKLRDFPAEVLAVKKLLTGLRKRFSKARIIYKHGNHEERYQRCMRHKCPEFLGIPEFEWANVFGLMEAKIGLVEHKRPIKLGKLNILHGHEYNFAISNPVNPARGFFLRAKTHVLGGHFHQSSNHSEKTLDGTVVSTWSTGCLCDLFPEYRSLNNWSHGFAWIDLDKDGAFQVQNFRIINGKVW